MDKVLISYSRRNLETVERLARDLQDAGLDVWVDFRKIKGGESWQQAIYQGIVDSDYVIVCMSPPAAESEWVRRELEMARQNDKLIIPVMLERAFDEMEQYTITKDLLNVQIINFADLNYERAFPTLLSSLPGVGREANYDDIDPSEIPNPFKGLHSFQETDADIFFGRESLVDKSIAKLKKSLTEPESPHFMAFVGASGSGKSSVVRAGIIPEIRKGALPESEDFPLAIFKPGQHPMQSLARRLVSLVRGKSYKDILAILNTGEAALSELAETILTDDDHYLVLVIDQFEEVFTRVGPEEQRAFFDMLHYTVTNQSSHVIVMTTMRADFFDNLSYFPKLAALYDSNNLVIVAEMSPEELRRSIEGPAVAVGLVYAHGLPDRILEEVLSQPGSLPLLQYALTELFERRDRRQLTWDSYNDIGGVRQALAQHAENVYKNLNSAEQDIMQRLLLRLVEVNENGEATRRRVERVDLSFERVSANALNDLLAHLTSADVRLLVTSREIASDAINEDGSEQAEPTVFVEIVHEALIREWERFRGWVLDDEENLRLSTEIMKTAQDWENTDQEPAYLLTETRLDRALVWLQTADATDLQREFVNASNAARQERREKEQEQQAYVYSLEERNRQRLRLLVGVLTVGVILAAGLAIYGFDQARRAGIAESTAVASQLEAEESARLVRSRTLAQEILQVAALPDTSLALGLALEANSFADAPPVAQSALAAVAYLGPRESYDGSQIVGAEVTVLDTVFVGESLQAVATRGNELVVFAVDDGTIIGEFDWVEPPQVDDNGTDDTADDIRTTTIASAALSPDGNYVVAGSTNGTVVVWQVTDANGDNAPLAQQTPTDGRVWDIEFTPDSTRFATGSNDGIIRLWRVENGTVITEYGSADTGHEQAALTLAFNRDGSRLVSGGADNRVLLWDVAAGNVLAQSNENNIFSWVRSVTFTYDGTRIAAGTSRGNVVVWDVVATERGTTVLDHVDTLEAAHAGAVLTIQFSPGDETFFDDTLVSAASDGSIVLWDANRLQRRHEYTDYAEAVTQVIYTPDRRALLSTGDDDRMIVWDVEQGAISARFDIRAHTDIVWDVALAPDDITALSGSSDGNLIVWDLEAEIDLLFIETGHVITAVEFSPDGTLAMAGAADGHLLLYDVASWSLITEVQGHIDTVRDIVFAPDGRTVLTSADDGTVIIWDSAALAQVRQVTFFDGRIWDIVGRVNATYDLDGFDEAANLSDLFLPTIWSMAYAPDGQHVLLGDENGEVIWWNPFEEGIGSALFLRDDDDARVHLDTVRAVAIAPDNTFALTASDDGVLRQWSLSGGTPKVEPLLYENTAQINHIAISSDGAFALTASETAVDPDNTLYTVDMWDIASGQRIRSLAGHTDWISTVRYSSDGTFAVSSSADNSLIEWRIDSARDLLAWTRENRAFENLNCETRLEWSVENCDENGDPPRSINDALDVFPTNEAMVTPIVAIVNGTPTPTVIPSQIPSQMPTLVPTSTPQAFTAQIGDNRGTLTLGSSDTWAFTVAETNMFTVRVLADAPRFANTLVDSNNPAGLDTVLQIFASDGTLVAENDDIFTSRNSNSAVVNQTLDPDTYQIVVRSFEDASAGGYTLVISTGDALPNQ